MRHLLISLLGMILFSVSVACSKKGTVAPLKETTAAPAVPTTKTPIAAPVAAPVTAPPASSKEIRLSRDPFRRSVTKGDEAQQYREYRGYSELAQLPLSDFRYVGIVTSETEKLALLEDRQGQGHTVRVGTQIGRNAGEVTEINDQEVIVKEIRKDASGRSSAKYVRLFFSAK